MINIQGIYYPVTMIDDNTMTTLHKCEDIIGHWSYRGGVELNGSLQGDARLPVLMHEIIHGIDDSLQIGLTEHQTQLLAAGMMQLLHANGGDVDWLRGAIDDD